MTSVPKLKPNIVIVIPTLKGAGAERVMLTLATNLKEQGCSVSIVVFKDIIELESGFDNVYHFDHYYRWIPRSIRGACLAPILDRFIIKKCGKPDLVLSNLLIVDRVLVHSRLNKHIIIHNTISSEIKHLDVSLDEYKKVYQGQSLICVSKGVMNDLVAVLPDQPAEKVRYIYNPVDQDYITKAASVTFQAPAQDYIVHVGSFSASKRHDRLIKAYAESGIEESLVLVGKGKLESESKKLVTQLGLEDKVIFAGFQSNPYPFIQNAKLLVLSSDYEGLGMVILEAVTLGVPVISTDCQSGPSEILPAKNLCPLSDIRAFANLMRQAVIDSSEFTLPLAKEFTAEYACSQYLLLSDNRANN